MKSEHFIRATIILVAVAVVCFVLVPVYASRPIQVTTVEYNITVAATPAPTFTPRPTAAPAATPPPGTAPAAGSPGEGDPAAEGGEPALQEVLVEKSIDINTASAEELDRLPGIGPALAQRIITYREENNGFYDIEEIVEVSGIGEKTFAKLEPYIFAS